MRVKSVRLLNFKSFIDSGSLELGPITVLVGHNNAGKSAVLQALHLLQSGAPHALAAVRIGADNAQVIMEVDDPTHRLGFAASEHTLTLSVMRSSTPMINTTAGEAGQRRVKQFEATEPGNLVLPYLSRRSVTNYAEDVRQDFSLQVGSDFSYLAAKLTRIANPSYPGHHQYAEACTAILGFMVTAVNSANGARPGVPISRTESIYIEDMGAGVAHVVGLLADLTLAEDKLILVEELENDLHPEALKALLAVLLSASERNQIVVTTHSSLVLRHLGAAQSTRIYRVATEPGVLPPVSRCESVGPAPADRFAVLRDLGYEMRDFDLWDGWLLLEEASAERIIREYLIPWFAPRLKTVRTVGARGVDDARATFEEFRRLVLFTHLEPLYRERTWVVLDGDGPGTRVVEELRERYATSWPPERFRTFPQPAFEHFYPPRFSARAAEVLSLPHDERREAKRALLEEVRAYCDEHTDEARAAFEQSAQEVITLLTEIEHAIFGA
jgi:hypothetical protein